MPTIAQGMIWYLQPTMGYIYDHLIALGSERSVVFAAYAIEPERFPFDRVYIQSPAKDIRALSPRDRAWVPPFDVLWRPIVRSENVALLHVHDGRIAPQFLPLARHHDIPMVTTFLGHDVSASFKDPHYVTALRLLFSRGDLFTVMSHDMARALTRLGCPESKIRVIHHGIPLSRFPFRPRRPPNDGPVIILTAGRLIPKKGPDDLMRAFALVCRRHSDVVLRVAGEGPLQPEMEAIVSEAGIRDRVVFLGRLEPGELAEEMRQAHLFCLPCRVGPDGDSEGIPNVLKEAMASGLPVVSTYHAGIPELVQDGVNGYLVPERDVVGVAERLCYLLDAPQQWEALGRAARSKVEAEFSLDAVVQQMEEEAYRPLLGSVGGVREDHRVSLHPVR